MKDLIRVLLVDDHATFLEHAAFHLNLQPNLSVVAKAQNGAEGIEKARLYQPDIILLDLVMPGLDGFAALPLLKIAAPEARIIVLTMLEVDPYKKRALGCGADGYIAKGAMPEVLLPEMLRLCGSAPSRTV